MTCSTAARGGRLDHGVQRLQADDDAGARVEQLVATSAGFAIGLIAVATQAEVPGGVDRDHRRRPFCSISASRSPGPRPSSRSAAASAQARSAASRKLIGVSK